MPPFGQVLGQQIVVDNRAGANTAPRPLRVPDVPTLDEAGLRGYEVIGWYGIYGPAKLPKPVLTRLYVKAAGIEPQ